MGYAQGTAQPFPLWRLRTGRDRRPSINVRISPPEHQHALNAQSLRYVPRLFMAFEPRLEIFAMCGVAATPPLTHAIRTRATVTN
jgi:hypothetical protein